MAPREIRAANLLYGVILVSSAGLLVLAGHAFGMYKLGAIEQWSLVWMMFATIGLLLLGLAGSDEERGAPG